MAAADEYLVSLRKRMAADGCAVTNGNVGSTPVLVGYKSQSRALAKMHIFVVAAKTEQVGAAEVQGFVDAAVRLANARAGKWRGMQSGIIVLPVLVAHTADADAAALTRRAHRLKMGGFAAFAQPAVVDLTAGKVWTFRGTRLWGYAFNSLIRQKCAMYLPAPSAE
ncbi:hypothetical protein ACGFI9_10905 [Micromonospora sp. NPDC048930]|uniref:hypothetical protein n=1 Tax=Micromonospora sp. NPDC048930 TaxID=3364261 RepID=UPI0037143138